MQGALSPCEAQAGSFDASRARRAGTPLKSASRRPMTSAKETADEASAHAAQAHSDEGDSIAATMAAAAAAAARGPRALLDLVSEQHLRFEAADAELVESFGSVSKIKQA
eukprot:3731631-Pleurochrysis_carterae.AAC.1